MFQLKLLILFVATVAANGFLPLLPVTPYVIWLGQFDHTPGHPVSIVLVAAAGNVIGWLLTERLLLRRYAGHAASLDRKIPALYRQIFLRQTGLSIFVFNALPFPGDPMRLLASVSGYPLRRALALIGAGRIIRYSLLVSLGAVLEHYKGLFWTVLILFLALPVFAWLVRRAGQVWTNPARPVAADVLDLDAPDATATSRLPQARQM